MRSGGSRPRRRRWSEKSAGQSSGRHSIDRRRILKSALIPEPVETALDLQRAVASDVALVHLTVVADGPKGPYLPVRLETHRARDEVPPIGEPPHQEISVRRDDRSQ